jgi:hypothetical protein
MENHVCLKVEGYQVGADKTVLSAADETPLTRTCLCFEV